MMENKVQLKAFALALAIWVPVLLVIAWFIAPEIFCSD